LTLPQDCFDLCFMKPSSCANITHSSLSSIGLFFRFEIPLIVATVPRLMLPVADSVGIVQDAMKCHTSQYL